MSRRGMLGPIAEQGSPSESRRPSIECPSASKGLTSLPSCYLTIMGSSSERPMWGGVESEPGEHQNTAQEDTDPDLKQETALEWHMLPSEFLQPEAQPAAQVRERDYRELAVDIVVEGDVLTPRLVSGNSSDKAVEEFDNDNPSVNVGQRPIFIVSESAENDQYGFKPIMLLLLLQTQQLSSG
ncbi:hypothetical protein SISSUDRAFT_1031633 [Sistotremastrum suecicum HHB10207 ss-3]|uniref:Uncharacterized protein n=1 Tax=Sistotremastrum suecicum HHB10207 ss-3 TaxID=1314776 RepID=A0A166FQK4_9AGAM|nr:hypothetical protein SISSUDRAFT_1031633 [Sistotremastrum suecicum HHB10207 ss-3]